jgi:carboxypeptidase C (cathepsin A)
MDGFFMEVGPLRILTNGTLVANEYSWHRNAHILFGRKNYWHWQPDDLI